MACFCRLFKFTNFTFFSQRRDFSSRAKKLIDFLFQIAFARSEIFQKQHRGIRGGSQPISCRHQWVYLIYCLLHHTFLTFCTGWFSIYFLLRDNENDLKFAMRCSTKFQRVVERCQHIANAFQNNNSALGSVSNGLKNVHCIFQRIFNAFFTYLLCRDFVNRVTYRLTHPTEATIRRLVSLTAGNIIYLWHRGERKIN